MFIIFAVPILRDTLLGMPIAPTQPLIIHIAHNTMAGRKKKSIPIDRQHHNTLPPSDIRYGLVWKERPDEVEHLLQEARPIAIEEPQLHIDAPTENAPIHTLIEGDNLAALTILKEQYREKVDIIYIDPPYNTGKDFRYNDCYTSIDDDYPHATWLSFIDKRLRAAYDLLAPEGIIFISINDNQQARLKLLCDDIFSEQNFVCQFVWEKSQHFGRQTKNSYSNYEYILCYCKNLRENGRAIDVLVESVDNNLLDAPLYNAINPVATITFPPGSVIFRIADGVYHHTSDKKYELLDAVEVVEHTNRNAFRLAFKSRWSAPKVIKEHENGCRFCIKSRNFAIRAVYPQERTTLRAPKELILTNPNNPMKTQSRHGVRVGTTESGSAELKEIIGNHHFNYPKPSSLIEYLIGLLWDRNTHAHKKDCLILDFFAGSGTTLQATMQLNTRDKGTRRCILVTNNENNICREITYPRISRLIKGYTGRGEIPVDGLTENSLRFYHIEYVPHNKE